MIERMTGGFTLPGEAGYEALTIELAKRWGADAIRDSDGTTLSERLLSMGLSIYATICIIRDHNEWANARRTLQQQCILCTKPRVMMEEPLEISLMEDFFTEQFAINDTSEAMAYWQVYDRTTNTECSHENWHYEHETGKVIIHGNPFHMYTVSFFAYRIWEEISMYNHTTNHWNKERLMQIDPIHAETRQYLKHWLHCWCEAHPETSVVRFTSLFYNFAWIWGSNARNRHLFTDWASYDFTVSPAALAQFEARYGYALTVEDFVNKGAYRATHSVPDTKKRDWMAFVHRFVCAFGQELVDIVHVYGKKAFVFYDDSWVGLEPYGEQFSEIGFDGIIKCVFSGFEARLCAGVAANTHEIRLHPYLFPVGLGGAPTFMEGGDPTADAKAYWRNVRRALLRQPVDRIGLGGYLHLVEQFPEFVDYIQALTQEFHLIKMLHAQGAPLNFTPRIAVLTAWGLLRSWTLSGHFHETDGHDLMHVIESLSGLPLSVRFIDFKDVKNGILSDIDVLICAGRKGTAWSGGLLWEEEAVVTAITAWVHGGGALIGINEPSALDGYATQLRMSHVLGVDIDMGERSCHGVWRYEPCWPMFLETVDESLPGKSNVYLTDGNACVWLERDGAPMLTCNDFGKGKGIYLSTYRYSAKNTRLLLQLVHHAANIPLELDFVPDNPYVECAWFSAACTLALINNSDAPQEGHVYAYGQEIAFALEAYQIRAIQLSF